MSVYHVQSTWSNKGKGRVLYHSLEGVTHGRLPDGKRIPNGDIFTFKRESLRLIEGSLPVVGLIVLHEQRDARSGNGRWVLDLFSGVGANIGEKHEMGQKYGYQVNFLGVGLPKNHQEIQRCLKRSEQSYLKLDDKGIFLKGR